MGTAAFMSTTEVAYADSPYTLRFGEPEDQTLRTGDNEYTVNVYVPRALCLEAYYYEITYTRVELNAISEKNNLKTNEGVFTSKLNKVLEENVKVTDVTILENGTEEKYGKFTVSSKVNCAWAFTVKYRNTDQDEVTYEFDTKILYCAVFDDAAPSILIPPVTKGIYRLEWVSGSYRINRILTDGKNVGANGVSGLNKATLYKRSESNGSEEYELMEEFFYNGSKSEEIWSCVVPNGVVSYYLEVTDRAGNDTGKVLLETFSDSRYNAGLESAVEIALEDLNETEYSREISYGLQSAYSKYLTTTRSTATTNDEKLSAQSDLYQALQAYQTAKQEYDDGVVNVTVEINDRTVIPSLQAMGLFSSLRFLKRGDTGTITLTPNKITATDKPAVLQQVGWENATSAYSIYIETNTTDAHKIRRAFSVPLILKMKLEESEKIVAVQEVFDTNGNVSYYECNVVEYADGTVSVDVPQTAGTVYILLDSGKKKSNLYWLFSLTAIPVLLGAGFFIYAHVKMKKIKEKAEQEKKEEQSKEEEHSKNNQKKKNKKRK